MSLFLSSKKSLTLKRRHIAISLETNCYLYNLEKIAGQCYPSFWSHIEIIYPCLLLCPPWLNIHVNMLIYYFYYYLLFWEFFTQMTANLFKSPGLSSVFWSILIMLQSGYSLLDLLFPSLLVFWPILLGPKSINHNWDHRYLHIPYFL